MGHLGPGAFLSYFLLHQAFFGKKNWSKSGWGKRLSPSNTVVNPKFFCYRCFGHIIQVLANGSKSGLGQQLFPTKPFWQMGSKLGWGKSQTEQNGPTKANSVPL